MAVDYGDDGTIPSGTSTETKTAGVTPKPTGFGLLSRMKVNVNIGAEAAVEKFLENSEEFIKSANRDVLLYKFSKEEFTFLEYSNVVVAKKSQNRIVYFIIQLASTGIAGQTPRAILDFEMSKNDPFRKSKESYIVLPASAIEDNLRNEIETTISDMESNVSEFVFVGGHIIHATEDITEIAVSALSMADAINNIEVTELVITNSYSDASLYEEAKLKDVRDLKLGQSTEPIKMLGGVRHQTFNTMLSLRDNKENQGINLGNGSIELAKTHGFVDVNVYEKQISMLDQTGRPVNTTNFVFFPSVVINTMELAVPTTGATLIALAQSAVISQGKRWVKVLSESTGAGKNIGVLESIKNQAVSGKTKIVDLTSSNFTAQDREKYIMDNMEDVCPILMDVPGFGFGTMPMTIYAIASSSSNTDAAAAREEIIQVAHEVSGGKFPIDYDDNAIFAGPSFKLPIGTYINKQKEVRSIDEIDLLFMLDKKNNVSIETIRDFIASGTGVQGADLLRMKVLSDIKLNINITGFKDRVSFNPMFIKTLLTSLSSSGLGFSVEASTVSANQTYGFGVTQSLYEAGLGEAGGFSTYGQGRDQGFGNTFFNNQYHLYK